MKNIRLNILFASLFSIINIFINLFRTRFIITYYGNMSHGLYVLLTQIIAYLSLMDVGFSSFFITKYYKYANNEKELSSIYSGYQRIQKKLCVAMILFGIIMAILIFNTSKTEVDLLTYFLIFASICLSYVVEQYLLPKFYLCDALLIQYKYKFPLFICISIKSVSLLILYRFVSFGEAMIVDCILTTVIYLCLSLYCSRILKNRNIIIVDNSKKYINRDIIHHLKHKISGLMILNTDAYLLSSIGNLIQVSIISPYLSLMTSAIDVINGVSSSITAVFSEKYFNNESISKIYQKYRTAFFLIAFFASLILYIFGNPFISIMLSRSDSMLMNNSELILICFCLFLQIYRMPIIMVNRSLGLYKETSNMILLEGIVKVILSIIFINLYGVVGIFISSIITLLLINYPNYIIHTHCQIEKNAFSLFIYEYKFVIVYCIVFFLISLI